MANLDKRFDSKNLIYRYKGNTPDVEFNRFDNAINIVNKIRDVQKELTNVKKNQEKFKPLLNEIKRTKKHFVQY